MTWSRKARMGVLAAVLCHVGGAAFAGFVIATFKQRGRPVTPLASAWSTLTGVPAPGVVLDLDRIAATVGRTAYEFGVVVGIVVAACAAFVGIPLLFASFAEAFAPVHRRSEIAQDGQPRSGGSA